MTPPRAALRAAALRVAGHLSPWAGVVALNYHRIGDGRRSVFDRGLWSATCDGFDAQLRWLRRHFDVVSPDDLPRVLETRRGRHVIVTFDDGYADNHDAALPILRAHGLSATFFVATGFIDEPRLPWWDEVAWMVRTSARGGVALPAFLAAPLAFDEPDRQRAIRTLLWTHHRLPAGRTAAFLDALAAETATGRFAGAVAADWMTWDQIRALQAGGMTIGGHTVSHQVLARVGREEQAREILGCCRRLEAELGVPVRTFSYPAGQRDSFDAVTRDCLREAGIRSAFSYYGGFRPLSQWDEYDIPRMAVEQDTGFDQFRAMVLAPWATRS